jgi:tetraacyldisaccharide 4'-kinase
MDVHTFFYELVSGRQNGFPASVLRGLLRTAEIPCTAAAASRNWLYDRRILPSRKLPVPILSVGNLTLGGTGKSPMTAWLCRFFLQQKLRPAFISRGYKKTSAGINDEYLELLFQFPDVPHIQNRNRIRAAEELLKQYQPDVIILDDAFQHRRIDRDTDIVLLDATVPFGFDHVFPRGTLREPVTGLKRADIVILSRSDLVSETERQNIRDRVSAVNPNVLWAEASLVPAGWVPLNNFSYNNDVQDFQTLFPLLRNQSVLAFCGIGNPQAFRKTLEQCGVRTKKLIPFPDHHQYSPAEICRILQTAKELEAEAVVCTMKDLVKLTDPAFHHLCSDGLTGIPFGAVSVEIRFTQGEAGIRNRIRSIG